MKKIYGKTYDFRVDQMKGFIAESEDEVGMFESLVVLETDYLDSDIVNKKEGLVFLGEYGQTEFISKVIENVEVKYLARKEGLLDG